MMTDLSQAFRAHWTEKRLEPQKMTDSERLDWFGEYCDEYRYSKPTSANIGYHVIICGGQRTAEASFRDAIDMAAAKHKESNT